MAVPVPPPRQPQPPINPYPPSPNQGNSALGTAAGPNSSFGGVQASATITLFPVIDLNGKIWLYTFDPTQGFNDMVSGSTYYFRVEDFAAARNPTARYVAITYRNLGPVTITVLLTGANDSQQIVSFSPQQPIQLGSANNIGSIMTYLIAITSFTAQNMQLSVSRAPGAGPLSITKVTLMGTVEEQTY